MAKILTFEIPENEYNDLQSFIKDCSAEIHKSLEIMKQDQAEIIALRQESRKIKENTDKITNDTRKLLDELSAKWLKVI